MLLRKLYFLDHGCHFVRAIYPDHFWWKVLLFVYNTLMINLNNFTNTVIINTVTFGVILGIMSSFGCWSCTSFGVIFFWGSFSYSLGMILFLVLALIRVRSYRYKSYLHLCSFDIYSFSFGIHPCIFRAHPCGYRIIRYPISEIIQYGRFCRLIRFFGIFVVVVIVFVVVVVLFLFF